MSKEWLLFPDTGSAPLISSKVIRDRASDRSIWCEKGSSDPMSDAKLDAKCVCSGADQMPNGVKRRLQGCQVAHWLAITSLHMPGSKYDSSN